MTRKEYLERRIQLVKESMTSFQRWSIFLFFISIVSVCISFSSSIDISFAKEFLQYGLTSITTFSGTALQGAKFTKKNKLLELEYCENLVDNFENLQDFDKNLINHALDGIILSNNVK